MKKRLLLSALLLIPAFLFAACNGQKNDSAEKPPHENDQTDNEVIDNADERSFSDDRVLIVLTEEASREYIFKDYTLEDFPGIGAISIHELDGATSATSGLTYKIRQCLLEDPSGNTIPSHLKHYCRSFCIILDKKDKDNVLNAVSVLERRADIDVAEPDRISSPDV